MVLNILACLLSKFCSQYRLLIYIYIDIKFVWCSWCPGTIVASLKLGNGMCQELKFNTKMVDVVPAFTVSVLPTRRPLSMPASLG